MAKKYSKIKKELQIKVDKIVDNDLAYLTHYFQNHKNGVSQYFKPTATEYLTELHEENNILKEPDFQYYLPIEWDIPFPPPKNPTFKFIDLFAGIGGIRLAYQNNGGKCVFSSEWDKFSKQTYEANFGEVPFGDITKISEKEIPDHDILLGGFPCQPFSIAGVSKKKSLGRQHGFLDKTQGTLFFDIARIIKHKKPKAFMLENVKNLVSHDKKKTFKIITETLTELGYSLHYKVLDGKYYVPQHRERIIIVGFKKSVFKGKETFEFPQPEVANFAIREILQRKVDDKYTLSDKLWNYLQEYKKKHQAKGNGFGFGLTDLNGISRTMSARYYKDGAEILIPQRGKNPRRLTPRECARLQGFPDNFIIPVSNNQAYKQFGNSVVMPLIQAVGNNIVKELSKLNEHIRESNSISTAV
ncbi:DNA (cytosine-5-)-methyltransferase [Allomuricauda sp. F6463D]|uniref:DNA (cytosine-5-)-methyltransferase n=1 Tax=Allomuricauda sp. F6463D TaxID=2926409 RepID=UPI001FF3141B|nr:DNA (cytosine-5-)-methyltransferase [Muricauda sp. F6463D]MCK0160499.1 DNA (cytosine-5-)-methyltransferase [Muricauda sp. F6463D]